MTLQEIDTSLATQNAAAAIAYSRTTYGTPKEEVERLLSELMGSNPVEQQIQVERRPEVMQTESSTSLPVLTLISQEEEIQAAEKFIRQKEESRHRYLQNLIKKMAESRGYKSVIEHPTPDGSGRVDVHLERNERKIACEVCVTTETEWELHNIKKCLAARYDLVVEISDDKKTLDNLKKKIIATFDADTRAKILTLEPNAFFAYLDTELAKEASTETRVRGYRVKVEYNTDAGGMEHKRKAVGKTVSDALKKKDKK